MRWRLGVLLGLALACGASAPAHAELRCADVPGSTAEPVLLVHGTGVQGQENWGWNYAKALPGAGIPACTVDLPQRALDDLQVAAVTVADAIRAVRRRYGRRVDVVGHSQGPLEPLWAMEFWPDVRAAVDDLVSQSGPHHGATTIDALCALRRCLPAAWQMRTGSAFLTRLNRDGEVPERVDVTTVISTNDGLVVPPSTSRLAGAANVVIQDLCPGRFVDHLRMLFDGAAWAITVDALVHDGPADVRRLGGACARARVPGVSERSAYGHALRLAPRLLLGAATHRMPGSEPPLAPYAR